jgi:hypothetical protein
VDDVVDPLAQGTAWGNYVESSEESGILAF